MKITRRQITKIINEELRLVAEAEKKKKSKQKVTLNGDESRDSAWAGGDNLVDPNDWEKTLDMIKEQNSDVLSREELHKVIFEELASVMSEDAKPSPMYEAEGGVKFTDESGESWNVDCKTKWAMSCGDSCSAKQFSNFSKGDQGKLSEMCSLNESKGKSRRITRSQLRKLIKEETINRKTQMKIKHHLPQASGDLVVNFFKHLGTHSNVAWDAVDLQAAFQNVRTKSGGIKNLSTLIQWISWIMKDDDLTAWKNLEIALKSAKDFNELNQALGDASEVANGWWPTSPGGQHEKDAASVAADEEDISDEEMMGRWGKPGVTKVAADDEEDISDEEMMDRWGKQEEEEE